MVQARTAMDVGAGEETELSYRNVLSGALVFLYCDITCRQPRLTTSRSKRQLAWICLGVLLQQGKASGRVDVYTQGWQGSDCRNNACSYGRLTGRLRCSFLDPGYETECAFFVLRSLACLPACPLCFRTVFNCLPSPTGTLIGPPRSSACPSACLLPLAVSSCARSWEPGLRPPVDLATRCFSDHPTVINARVRERVREEHWSCASRLTAGRTMEKWEGRRRPVEIALQEQCGRDVEQTLALVLPQMKEGIAKQSMDILVPLGMEDLVEVVHEVVKLVPQERAQQRTAEQLDDAPQFPEKTVEVVRSVPRERVQQRTA